MKLTKLLESENISDSQKTVIKQLIKEHGEGIEFLTESNSPMSFRIAALSEKVQSEIDGNGHLLVKGVPATILDEKNANGRIYGMSTMSAALDVAKSHKVFENKQLFCTADDHPESTFVKPVTGSHIVTDAYIKQVDGKNVLFNDWLILDTHSGKDLKAIIKAGGSPGTSIRGLGRQDEKTGEIHEYKFLGTDVVGNPSAGTFAPFNGYEESITVTVESISENCANKIIESTKKSKENEMFNLDESIKKFHEKHGQKPEMSSSVVSDVLAIEQEVFDNNADVGVYEDFKIKVLGKAPEVEESVNTSNKNASAKNADVLNKTERKLGASEVVTSHLKEELTSVKEDFSNYKKAANLLMNQFAEKAKLSSAEKAKIESQFSENGDKIFKACQEQAIQLVEEMKQEAKKVIENLEYQLEAAIQIGDAISDNFFAMKAIAESLRARILEMEDNKDEEDKASIKGNKDVKASSKKETIAESTDEKVKNSATDPISHRKGPMSRWR